MKYEASCIENSITTNSFREFAEFVRAYLPLTIEGRIRLSTPAGSMYLLPSGTVYRV